MNTRTVLIPMSAVALGATVLLPAQAAVGAPRAKDNTINSASAPGPTFTSDANGDLCEYQVTANVTNSTAIQLFVLAYEDNAQVNGDNRNSPPKPGTHDVVIPIAVPRPSTGTSEVHFVLQLFKLKPGPHGSPQPLSDPLTVPAAPCPAA